MLISSVRNSLVVLATFCLAGQAQAFWWLAARAAAGRSAVGTVARAGAGAVGAVEAQSALAAGARFCLRPVRASSCDFRVSASAMEAVSSAVGPGYRVRQASRPSLFEVIDAAGTVVDIIQAVSVDAEPKIAALPQHQPHALSATSYGGQSSPVMVSPLRHNGDVLIVPVNGTPTVVWSDGHVEVWADGDPHRVVLLPGHRLTFPNHGTIHVIPKSSDAYTLFNQPTGRPRVEQPQLRAPPAVFPYGSSVACPQVPIGNGMARCQ